jgi:hypothetical protein
MRPILPEGEELRRALRWLNEERDFNPQRSSISLVEEAAMRFNLSPLQEEWLLAVLRSPMRPSESHRAPQ